MIDELNSLLEAELGYAYFNARRTTVESPNNAISRSSIKGVSHVADSNRPLSEYYNRAVVHPDSESLAELLQHIPATVRAIELLIPQQTEENFTCLLNAGFTPAFNLCYLIAIPSPTPSPECTVLELRADQRDFFFDLLELSGAAFPAEKRRVSGHFYCTESFRCLVAFDSDNQPMGWATMYTDGGTAFLANAFTLPEHREKGVHSALLSARLNLASQLQLSSAFTDVEPASGSHRNCVRHGFRLLSVNNIWKRT